MNTCKKDSKKYCMSCKHYDYCDRANRCDGHCSKCNNTNYENNPNYEVKNEQ